jgi:Spy/CpxP family protein refolding chaperone
MAKHQQALLEKLNLSPAQKIQYDAMQSARQDLRKQKQANMVAHQKTMSEQASKEQMDPRAVIEADKQSRAMMETKRIAAEQKWLGFWDGLTPEQRKTFTADMKMRQEQHAQKPHRAPQG